MTVGCSRPLKTGTDVRNKGIGEGGGRVRPEHVRGMQALFDARGERENERGGERDSSKRYL